MHERVNRRASVWGLALVPLVALGVVVPPPSGAQTTEWRAYGGDVEGTKYSPLDQIDAGNFNDLEIVWRQSVLPDAVRGDREVSASLAPQNTPLMANSRLYISTGLGTVAALDATTEPRRGRRQSPG